MCCIVPFAGMYAYVTVSPFLFQKVLGLSPSEYGNLSIYMGAGTLLYGFINTRLIKYFSLERAVLTGAIIVISSGVLLLLFNYLKINTVFSVMLPVILYYSIFVFCVSNANALALSLMNENYGTARALISTGQFLAGAIGSFIFSKLPIVDGFYLAICFVVNGILVMSFVLFGSRFARAEISQVLAT